MPDYVSDIMPAYTPEQLSRVRLENACVAYQSRISMLTDQMNAAKLESDRVIKELMTQVKELMPIAKQLEKADELLAQKNATLGMLTEKLSQAEARALALEEELRYVRGRT